MVVVVELPPVVDGSEPVVGCRERYGGYKNISTCVNGNMEKSLTKLGSFAGARAMI